MSTAPPQDPKNNGALHLAVLSANAFRASAQPLIRHLSELGPKEAESEAEARLGEVIVSATTTSFSLELYLKALCILEGKTPPGGHDLWKHYEELSPDRKAAIADAYESVPKLRGKSRALVVKHAPFGDPTPPPPDPLPPPGSADLSFRTVLKDSRKVFVHLRYFHQAARPGQVRTLVFDFYCLDIIAGVLNAHLTEILGRVVTRAQLPKELKPS